MRIKPTASMNPVAALKGNLGLRSSPLSPTASKLSTQYLVLDHMANHYKKIGKAKSAIDSKPPKTMQTSQKARDNKRRKDYEMYGRSRSMSSLSRNTPTPTQRHNEDIYNETLWSDPEDEEDELVRSIMRTTLQTTTDSRQPTNNNNAMGKTLRYHQDLHHNNAMATTMRPMSSRSVRSARSYTSNASRLTEVSKAKNSTYDGDVLQKRSHCFTEPDRPFTPRTLKSNRQSKLSQFKYYTPPKQKRAPRESNREPLSPSKTEDLSKTITSPSSKPLVKPRKSPNKTQENTNTFSESHMYESLQSRDFEQYGKDPNVPRLDITVDNDHRQWLEEQADKVKQTKYYEEDEEDF